MDPLSPLNLTREEYSDLGQQLNNALISPMSPTHEQLDTTSNNNPAEKTSLSLFTNLPSENSSVNLNSPTIFSNPNLTSQTSIRSTNSTTILSPNLENPSGEHKLSSPKYLEVPNLTSSTLFYDIPNNDPLTDMLTRHATTDHRRRSLSVKKPFDNREDLEAVYEMMVRDGAAPLHI
ncbi:hypothetical protein K7432_011612 [Basidiobolus ranarum]|uniref:Uncharacterized protein n=1 Tax=Basidiobolus ranarum TaxID=34480 RepID=A0ABR2VUG2_9FUNG